MEVQSFNQELVYANLQFKRLFNNIRIESSGKIIPVTCVIGNRSRIFKNLENPEKNSQYKLPMVIIQRNGLTKNNDRLANINNEVKYATNSRRLNYNIYTPVPIDVHYQVTVVSKYQDQIDKIISNFIPFFNKDLFVRCEHPKFEGLTYTNQVIMDDSIDEEHLDELDPSQDDVIQAQIGFTFKTYLFCGNQKAERAKTEISSYISSVVSSYVYELNSDDKKNIDRFLDSSLSTTLTTIVDVPMTAEVPISGEPSDPSFIPEINRLYFGFYPIPLMSSYIPHMNWVDSLPTDVKFVSSYVSTDISGNMHEMSATTSAAYHPYVDRILWKIGDDGDLYQPVPQY